MSGRPVACVYCSVGRPDFFVLPLIRSQFASLASVRSALLWNSGVFYSSRP